jgi:hypothetical protein
MENYKNLELLSAARQEYLYTLNQAKLHQARTEVQYFKENSNNRIMGLINLIKKPQRKPKT